MSTARLRFEGGDQIVTHTPWSRQTSATWELQDLRYPSGSAEYVVVSGSESVDAFSETITADVGPGEADPTRMTMADTSGLSEGVYYWLSDTLGGESVLLAGLVANAFGKADSPIAGTYQASEGARLQGLTFTATIPAAVSADSERMQYDHLLRMVWTYGDGERHQQQVRVRRNDYDDADLVAVKQDVVSLFPDVHHRTEHQGGSTLGRTIATVYRQFQALERARGNEPSLQMGGAERHFALVWRVLLHLSSQGMVPGTEDPEAWVEYCRGEFQTFWGGSVTGPGGKETGRVSRATDAGTGSEDLVHQNVVLDM